jgi:hypothetical protein
MVKLLRLKGDATVDNLQITSEQADNIICEPGSKISVRSLYAEILTVPQQELFYILNDIDYTWGSSTLTLTSTLPKANYQSITDILTALNIASNSTGTISSDWLGIHSIWAFSNLVTLSVYKADFEDAGFDTEWVFQEGADSMTLSANQLLSDGIENVQLVLPYLVPLSGARVNVVVDSVDPISWSAVPFDDPDTALWGFDINENNDADKKYFLLFRDENNDLISLESTTLVTVTHRLQLNKFGNAVSLVIRDVAGLLVETLSGTLGSQALSDMNLFWFIEIPIGSEASLSDCQCNSLSLDPTTLTSSNVSVTLSFASSLIEKYLGFGSSPYSFSGDPAVLTATSSPKGTSTYPGIMIVPTIPLDLESYSSTTGEQSNPISFIDVIENPNNSPYISYAPEYPIALTMSNSYPVNLRNLGIRLVSDTTGKPLEFIGSPVVVLQIHDANS